MFGFYSNFKNFYESNEGYELFVDDPEIEFGKYDPNSRELWRLPLVMHSGKRERKCSFFRLRRRMVLQVELKEIGDPRPGQLYPNLNKSEGKAIPQYSDGDDEF